MLLLSVILSIISASASEPSPWQLVIRTQSIFSVKLSCHEGVCHNGVARVFAQSVTRENLESGISDIRLRDSVVQIEVGAECAQLLQAGLTHEGLRFRLVAQEQRVPSLEPEPSFTLSDGDCEALSR